MRANLFLLILAVVLAVPTTLTIIDNQIIFEDYQEVPRLFDGFDPDNVVTIQVQQPRLDEKGMVIREDDGGLATNALVMTRPSGQEHWVFGGNDPEMRGVRVRQDRVRDYVLQHIEAIRMDENSLVAEDVRQEDLKKYGLEDGNPKLTAIVCLDKVGKPLAQIFLGRDTKLDRREQKGLVRGYFVRRPDRSDVILYEAEFWQVSTDKQQWVDRNIFYRFPTDQAVELALKNNKGAVKFAKARADEIDWGMVEGPENQGAVRQAEVNALLQSLQLLDAPQFIRPLGQSVAVEEDMKALGFDEPLIDLSVKLANGELKRMRVGKKLPNQNFFYMLTSTIPTYVLGVGDYQMHGFEAAPTKFFDPPAESAVKQGKTPEEVEQKENPEAAKEGDAAKPPAAESAAGEGIPAKPANVEEGKTDLPKAELPKSGEGKSDPAKTDPAKASPVKKTGAEKPGTKKKSGNGN